MLVQLSLIPFGIASALLPLTHVSAWQYCQSCTISRLKLILWVWIGVSATDLVQLIRSLRSDLFSTIGSKEAIPTLMSLVGSILALAIISWYSSRKLESLRREGIERQIDLAQINQQPQAVAAAYRNNYGHQPTGMASSQPPLSTPLSGSVSTAGNQVMNQPQ